MIGREREADTARVIAKAIKKTLVNRGFDAITCSIGIALFRFLTKTASDIHKPDGLTIIELLDLPDALFGLQLPDFCGVGSAMEQRLLEAGIRTAEQLCRASRPRLRAAWGRLVGERFGLQV